jgi:hypothetical protein
VNNPHLSENKILFGEFSDFNIPFPRCSGARFCGDSKLVCFGLTRQYTVKVGTDTSAVLHVQDIFDLSN